MAESDQTEVVEFLTRGASYGRPGETPQRIDTHGSIVFLIGDRVFKLKRAVRFSFLDYSTVAAREGFCRAELALNRRTAPKIYLAVRALTRDAAGGIAWDGDGSVLDWVVEMRRFDDGALFDQLAMRHELTPPLLMKLADAIARFHQEAEITPGFGGAAGIAEVIEDNHQNLVRGCPPFSRDAIEALLKASKKALTRCADVLDRRRTEGHVRRCHGDLHLRNICLFEGEPTLFDCIEFSDAFACTDVLYDLAFLLMDLEHRGLRPLANIVFNRYLDRSDEMSGLAALPLFLSVRASVRAKVAVATLALHPTEAKADGDAYLRLAASLLAPGSPRLVAVGGLSGTGKSTIASGLAADFAPAPGARIIRSDVLRKTLMKVAPETKLPPSAYSEAVSTEVYGTLRDQARAALEAGYSVIADGTFMNPTERAAIAAVAAGAGVPFEGLWLTAPDAVLMRRVAGRRGDASDADQDVLAHQLRADLGALTWRRVDVSGSAGEAVDAARQALTRPKTG
jgi:uncharacterized protein